MTMMAEIKVAEDRVADDCIHFTDSIAAAASISGEKPVFCFSASALKHQVSQFLANFPGEVAYAVKANPSGEVIQGAYEAGIRVFDVASTLEMETVTRLCGGSTFHYHNPVKSRAEIATAYHAFGCRRFAADCVEEIGKIARSVGSVAGVELAIRFRLPSGKASVHDFSSKFGVDEFKAAELMQYAVKFGFLPILTFHPGSQCTDPVAWKSHIQAAGRIARLAGVKLTKLNVGGGFPARYSGSRGQHPGSYFNAIADTVTDVFGDNAPALECEPGRAICAPSFSLLTRVKLVRSTSNDVFLNDGIYGGLLEVTQAPGLLPFYRVIRNGKQVETEQKQEYTIFGPTCDPLDVLPNKLSLPVGLQEGDIIEFAGIGAYGMATSTRFNGYGDAQTVFVETAYRG